MTVLRHGMLHCTPVVNTFVLPPPAVGGDFTDLCVANRGWGLRPDSYQKNQRDPAASLLLPSQRVANRLGLQHHPLRGAAVAPIMFGGHSAPVRALTEPLTVQLLAGPGNIAFQITIPVVLVVPSRPEGDQIELQLGLFDFCQEVQFDFLPLWASQFTHVPTGYSWALPVIAPQQRSHYIRTAGTSTFHITQECYDEVGEGVLAGGWELQFSVAGVLRAYYVVVLLPWLQCTANACHLLLTWVD